MNGEIWGYDPGGNKNHGVAKLVLSDGKPTRLQCNTCADTENVLKWFGEKKPLGLGVDTLTEWGIGESGWRPADKFLREKYREVSVSIVAPNSLRGAMAIAGMSVLLSLRCKWLELVVSETHPKVVWFALTKIPYKDPTLEKRNDWLCSQLRLQRSEAKPLNDNEWDALVSAYCVWQGLIGSWRGDLHALTSDTHRVKPAGPTSFYWPEIL